MHIGFVSGLSDHKLAQKLAPLQAMPEVSRISLFRRQAFAGEKVQWRSMPQALVRNQLLGDAWRMSQLFRYGAECDILVGCHQRFHGVMTAFAGKILNIPTLQLIITEFDVMWAHPAYRWAIRQAVAVGVRGQKARRLCVASLGAASVPTFIAHNRFTPPDVNAAEIPSGRDIDILYVGSFTKEKNLPLLARVLAGVKAMHGGMKVCIIGEGEGERGFRADLERLGLGDGVTILSNRSQKELQAYYARSRLLLLTSSSEGLPMVVPEAMGSGTPVVATDVGDIGEWLHNGKNGFLIDNRNAAGLIAACGRIIGDSALQQRLGAAARAVYGDFVAASSLEATMGEWRRVFTALTEKNILPAL